MYEAAIQLCGQYLIIILDIQFIKDKKIDKGRNVYSKLYKIRSNLYLNSKIYMICCLKVLSLSSKYYFKNPNNISFKKNLKLQSNYFNKHLPNNSYMLELET